MSVAVRVIGTAGVLAPLALAAAPADDGLTPGREWEAGILLAGGLISAGALILEHRGYRNASVALLVGTAITGGVLAALRALARRQAAARPAT